MTGWIVAGCILLALLLIGQLRVGAAAAFSEEGLFLKVKAGPVWLQMLPAKEKKKKKEKPPKPPKKHPAEEGAKAAKPKGKITDTVSLVLRFVPLLAQAAGQFKRKLRIDRLNIHVIWGAADPAAAAQGYGAGNALLGVLWPPLGRGFNIKEHDLRLDVDFERKNPAITVDAQATLTIGQIVTLALRVGFQALKIYLGFRREQKRQKAVQA